MTVLLTHAHRTGILARRAAVILRHEGSGGFEELFQGYRGNESGSCRNVLMFVDERFGSSDVAFLALSGQEIRATERTAQVENTNGRRFWLPRVRPEQIATSLFKPCIQTAARIEHVRRAKQYDGPRDVRLHVRAKRLHQNKAEKSRTPPHQHRCLFGSTSQITLASSLLVGNFLPSATRPVRSHLAPEPRSSSRSKQSFSSGGQAISRPAASLRPSDCHLRGTGYKATSSALCTEVGQTCSRDKTRSCPLSLAWLGASRAVWGPCLSSISYSIEGFSRTSLECNTTNYRAFSCDEQGEHIRR